jgi:ferritin-like metal-binding protein YciE
MNFGTCIARRISSSKPFRSWPKGAKNGRLKALFTDHLEETKGQVLRLKQVFEMLEEKPAGEHCNGMEGVIEEGADALEKDEEGASFDSGILGAAFRTEHYEIAGYTAAIAMADTLGLKHVSGLLVRTCMRRSWR